MANSQSDQTKATVEVSQQKTLEKAIAKAKVQQKKGVVFLGTTPDNPLPPNTPANPYIVVLNENAEADIIITNAEYVTTSTSSDGKGNTLVTITPQASS